MIERAEKLLVKAEEIERETEERIQTLKEEVRNSRKALALKILEQEEKSIKEKIKGENPVDLAIKIAKGIDEIHSHFKGSSLLPEEIKNKENSYKVIVSKEEAEIKLANITRLARSMKLDNKRPQETSPQLTTTQLLEIIKSTQATSSQESTQTNKEQQQTGETATGEIALPKTTKEKPRSENTREYEVVSRLREAGYETNSPKELQSFSNSEISKGVPLNGYRHHALTESVLPDLEINEEEKKNESTTYQDNQDPLAKDLNEIKSTILAEKEERTTIIEYQKVPGKEEMVKKEIPVPGSKEESALTEKILKRYWARSKREREKLWEENRTPNYLIAREPEDLQLPLRKQK